MRYLLAFIAGFAIGVALPRRAPSRIDWDGVAASYWRDWESVDSV